MSAPKKQYVDRDNPPAPRMVGVHFVMPVAALQALVRLILNRENLTEETRRKLETPLFHSIIGFSDPSFLKLCEEDQSLDQVNSTLSAVSTVEEILEGLLRPCPIESLRVQAQGLDLILEAFPFRAGNASHAILWLRDHFPDIQLRVSQSSICNSDRIHPTTIPDDQTLTAWAGITAPRDLRNTILAYLHGLSRPSYMAQLLTGRAD